MNRLRGRGPPFNLCGFVTWLHPGHPGQYREVVALRHKRHCPLSSHHEQSGRKGFRRCGLLGDDCAGKRTVEWLTGLRMDRDPIDPGRVRRQKNKRGRHHSVRVGKRTPDQRTDRGEPRSRAGPHPSYQTPGPSLSHRERAVKRRRRIGSRRRLDQSRPLCRSLPDQSGLMVSGSGRNGRHHQQDVLRKSTGGNTGIKSPVGSNAPVKAVKKDCK